MPDPTAVNTVTLYGYVFDAKNAPAAGTLVYVRLKNSPNEIGNVAFLRTTIKLRADDTGYFSVDLPASKWATISIPSANIQKSGLLPFTGSLSFTQLGG